MSETSRDFVARGPEAAFFGLASEGGNAARPSRLHEPLVRVIDEDPDLGALLDEERLVAARRSVRAREVLLERGPWNFFPEPRPGDLGSLILDGFVLVTVGIPRREHHELLGPGDVVSPWIEDDGAMSVVPLVTAAALTPVRLAHLERAFALQIAGAPEIYAALIHRLIVRARRLSLQAAVNGIPTITQRLSVTLWHLAERYGHMTPEGLRLSLPITHAQLAGITASQRPSITSSLKQLRAEGIVDRKPDRSWLIRGERPAALEELARQAGLAS
jgi:CRP/FNR family transcriptional regulator, cyclic AMP receptor protein